MSFYVFDLDGTLTKTTHREGLIPDWEAFYNACDKDEPVWPVIDLMTNLEAEGHRIEIWSGRINRVRDKTIKWFEDIGIFLDQSNIVLHMRAEDDHRPDEIIKAELLEQSFPHVPDVIFDDRQKVVDMWRAHGIVCAQVAKGDYDAYIRPSESVADGEDIIMVLMVGPTCAGKSTWIKNGMKEWLDGSPEDCDQFCVVSSDGIRANLLNDCKSQKRNKDVFKALEALVRVRMQCGLRTIVDATNLDAAWRKKLVSLAPANMKVLYAVLNRQLGVKLAHKEWRDSGIIVDQDKLFKQQLTDILAGDGLPNVAVRAEIYEDDGNTIILEPSEFYARS